MKSHNLLKSISNEDLNKSISLAISEISQGIENENLSECNNNEEMKVCTKYQHALDQNKDLKLSIIVADDIVINIAVMEVNLNALKVAKTVEYCYNGYEALQAALN